MFRQRIAVFFNEPALVGVCEDYLRGAGYNTIGTANSLDAFHFDLTQIDGVVMEHMLAGFETEAFVEQFERQKPSIPILFMSAYAFGQFPEHCRPPIAGRYMRYPFRPTQLLWSALGVFGPWGEKVPPKRSTQPLFVG
jgi:CheY-like chemotaxis protein